MNVIPTVRKTDTYYFWKWAENDLPGEASRSVEALKRGRLPRTLRQFDASPLLSALRRRCAEAREVGEPWECSFYPENRAKQAHFVRVRCCPPFPDGRLRAFDDLLLPLGLAGWSPGGRPSFGLPKLNRALSSQFGDADDVDFDSLPFLIRRIKAMERNPFLVLENARMHFVQCYKQGRRYVVEWRENHDLRNLKDFDHWKAQDGARLAALPEPYVPSNYPADVDPDLLTFRATVGIFQDFYRGAPRPDGFHWRHINADLAAKTRT